MKKITYKKSGVDIAAAEKFKLGLKSVVRTALRPEVLQNIGGFGSLFRFSQGKYKNPVLVSSADGVGTKLKIALLADKHDTVGIDAVAMNVNDILCTGAEPLFFLDYIAHSTVSARVLHEVVKGIASGCRQAGCALVGGETAQMPGMYARSEYDIAGFCVGAVEKSQIIDGSRIRSGDVIIGLASSGLHSNGYSLVRKVFSQAELRRYRQELLKPTRIYVKPVLDLLRTRQRASIHGVAHITGGAFYDKIRRILPEQIDALIRKDSWRVPSIFRMLQKKGALEDKEMYHTLNMGIGMVLIVPLASSKKIISLLSKRRIPSWIIGEVIPGSRKTRIV